MTVGIIIDPAAYQVRVRVRVKVKMKERKGFEASHLGKPSY